MPTTDPDLPEVTAPDALLPDPVLAEYTPGSAEALTDAQRWPTLDASGLRRVTALRDDPHAPRWAHRTGDRLTAEDHATLAGLQERRADSARETGPAVGSPPAWVAELVERVHRTVPRYRRLVRQGAARADARLDEVEPVARADLRDIASFVPLDVPLDRVLEGTSSGSTGAALRIPLHPLSVAADVLLLRDLLAEAGVAWRPDAARLALVNLVDQQAAFTYASAMTAMPAGPGAPPSLMARVNLDAGAWRASGDREAFLARWDPQVISTTPLALLTLSGLVADGLELHPVGLVSGAMHLTPAARSLAEHSLGAPVVDLYGLRETGAVASRADDGAFTVVARRVWVEILDPAGRSVPDGCRGEVVVTVDENPYLPLLRYRTGDHASREVVDGGVRLVGLEGRAPVRFARRDGAWRPSVDATQLLQSYGMAAWHMHQRVDGVVELTVLPAAAGAGSADTARDAARAVERLLDQHVELAVRRDPRDPALPSGRRFSSALDPLAPAG